MSQYQFIIPGKIDHLKCMLKYNPFHVIAVSETHCDDTITDQEISLDGFSILRNDRNRNGGGVPCTFTAPYHTLNLTMEVRLNPYGSN